MSSLQPSAGGWHVFVCSNIGIFFLSEAGLSGIQILRDVVDPRTSYAYKKTLYQSKITH